MSLELKQRLCAILCADVAGYSRLMSIDDRATVASLDASREVFRTQIESSGGRVVDMAGDSVLASFDTATGAVTAALAIQAGIGSLESSVREELRMRFRIGIHLGDVMEKADGTVYGDGVNIAARLEALAPPGGIAVSDSVRSAVKGKVGATFEDRGKQAVKNIADPVHAFVVQVQARETARLPNVGEIDLSLPGKPSIAVLAFENMSGDEEQRFFTDGITEDIITELSRFQDLFVIARNSSFSYKGRHVDVKHVGRELGVRYVLEGSMRCSGKRIRVTAQLIDCFNGSHLWAEKYDRVLEDVFAVQEEITQCIVATIAPHIVVAESAQARRLPGNVNAYEVGLRARAMVQDGWQKSDHTARAEGLVQARAALLLDPDCLPALDAVANAQWYNAGFGIAVDRESAWLEGMAAAGRGIALSRSETSHAIRALLLAYAPVGDYWDEALVDARTACQINPHNCSTAMICAHVIMNAGEPSEGLRILERVLRINPRDPLAFGTYEQLALALFHLAEYSKGLEWGLAAISAAPNHGTSHIIVAALYVGSGEIEKGKATLKTARQLVPGFVQSRVDGFAGMRAGTFRERYIRFLRIAAGVEDPSAAIAKR